MFEATTLFSDWPRSSRMSRVRCLWAANQRPAASCPGRFYPVPLSSGLWLIYTGMLWTINDYKIWCLLMFYWCFIDVLLMFYWCFMMLYDVCWYLMMFDDVFWRSKYLESWNAVDVQSASRWSLCLPFWSSISWPLGIQLISSCHPLWLWHRDTQGFTTVKKTFKVLIALPCSPC